MRIIKNMTQSIEDIPAGIRIKQLEEQKRYQQGRLQYTILNNGTKKKQQYHLDKIEYIDSRISELRGAEV